MRIEKWELDLQMRKLTEERRSQLPVHRLQERQRTDHPISAWRLKDHHFYLLTLTHLPAVCAIS